MLASNSVFSLNIQITMNLNICCGIFKIYVMERENYCFKSVTNLGLIKRLINMGAIEAI